MVTTAYKCLYIKPTRPIINRFFTKKYLIAAGVLVATGIGLSIVLGKGKRNQDYPQFSDHYFTGDYPVKPTDHFNDEKVTQLSLLSSKSNN